MCGRLVQATAIKKLAVMLHILQRLELPPRFNVAPSLPLAVVRAAHETGVLEWALPRWGLVPHWAKEINTGYKMINAKAETVHEKPAYRGPLRYHRCIIPADGFYEWRAEGKRKQPYYLRARDDGPLLLAGLWDRWNSPDGALETCTILTTAAQAPITDLHDRMPVMLDLDSSRRWLDPKLQDTAGILKLLAYAAADVDIYPVSPRVNSAANDDEQLITPTQTAGS